MTRLASVDVFRGLVMVMMLAEVLRLPDVAREVAKRAPGSTEAGVWAWLGWFQTHAPWRGMSPHDVIQPAFSFLVGTSLALSLAARRERGESAAGSLASAAQRAVVLVLLGVFLRSLKFASTNTTFEDTLSQIGLGYVPLYLLARTSRRVQLTAVGVILAGYWLLFALWPLPGAGFDWAAVGVPPDWPHHPEGFAGHWSKNSNPAAALDRWLLNQFPRAVPFAFNGGGYATLNFVPTLATMLLGLLARDWLRAGVGRLLAVGWVCLAAGLLLDQTGVCPSVKRIWTPAWVLVSGGVCCVLFAGIAWVTDVRGHVRWALPLVVVGANSIVAYVVEHTARPFTERALVRHLGREPFRWFGPEYEPALLGAGVLAVFWAGLWWLWRCRAFVRV